MAGEKDKHGSQCLSSDGVCGAIRHERNSRKWRKWAWEWAEVALGHHRGDLVDHGHTSRGSASSGSGGQGQLADRLGRAGW